MSDSGTKRKREEDEESTKPNDGMVEDHTEKDESSTSGSNKKLKESNPSESNTSKSTLDDAKSSNGDDEGHAKDLRSKDPSQNQSTSIEKKDDTQENDKSTSVSSDSQKSRMGIIEEGLIYFFYRPRVQTTGAHSLADVQRMYFALVPKRIGDSSDSTPISTHKARLIFIAKKQLPHLKSHARHSGQIESVCDASELRNVIQQYSTSSSTSNSAAETPTANVPSARPLGAGVYAIVSRSSQVHLAYALEQPEEIGEVQKAFNISKEGSFIITIKNPETPSPVGTIQSTVKYPKELLQKFGGRSWLGPVVKEMLDYEGAVVLLIGESEDIGEVLGAEVEKEVEDMRDVDMKEHVKKDDQIWVDLKLSKKEFPVEAIFDGEWV